MSAILRASACATTLAVTLAANAAPIEWPITSGGNGHFYELVTTGIDWNAALADAGTKGYSGLPGYLVTITSAAENQFLIASFNSQADSYAWIAGTDNAAEGAWRWVAGPEQGIQFADGRLPTTPFNFANWADIEPDNNGVQNYAVIQFGDHPVVPNGRWGDIGASGVGLVNAYVVEYSALSPVPEPTIGLLLSLGLAVGFIRRHSHLARCVG